MKKTFIILCIGAVLCSCTKYLDIKPYGQTIPQTAEEFSALLHYHLDLIDQGEETILGNISSVCDYECYTDNLEAILQSYPKGNYIPLYIGDQLNDKQLYYSNLYAVIRDCNIIIDGLEERNTQVGKDVLGTAHAIRGVCYYNLLRNFCEPAVNNGNGLGVPVVTHFDMEDRVLRSTISQTVQQAESDMLAAISYDISDEIYRFNSDVMRGYLARLYFWAGNWSDAIVYARQVLEKYPLLSGNAYLSMMQEATTMTGNMLIKSCIHSDKRAEYNSAMDYVACRPVSKSLVGLYDADKENDIRYSLSFSNRRILTKNAFSCLRSAEMQLILAESLYHDNDTEGALSALNEFRRNRITGVIDYTMETLPAVNEDDIIKEDALGNSMTPLLYAILNERRKEFFMEGDRWYELKRNGRPEMWTTKNGLKYTTFEYMYTFPLPVEDIELVEGLVQNPGYDEAI